MSQTTQAAPVVYLLGPYAVGKYTVAKILAEKTGFQLVDNHLISNPILGLIPAESKASLSGAAWDALWDKVLEIRAIVFDAVTKFSTPDVGYILTNALWEQERDASLWFDQVVRFAQQRGAPLVVVHLEADPKVLLERVSTPERRNRHKLSDPARYAEVLAQNKPLQPRHPDALRLDVTNLSPEETAEHVLAHVNKLTAGHSLVTKASAP